MYRCFSRLGRCGTAAPVSPLPSPVPVPLPVLLLLLRDCHHCERALPLVVPLHAMAATVPAAKAPRRATLATSPRFPRHDREATPWGACVGACTANVRVAAGRRGSIALHGGEGARVAARDTGTDCCRGDTAPLSVDRALTQRAYTRGRLRPTPDTQARAPRVIVARCDAAPENAPTPSNTALPAPCDWKLTLRTVCATHDPRTASRAATSAMIACRCHHAAFPVALVSDFWRCNIRVARERAALCFSPLWPSARHGCGYACRRTSAAVLVVPQ